MPEVLRINWVNCPKCKNRFYIGSQLLLVNNVPAICPKCRTEFDPKPNLEPRFSEVTIADKWL